MLSLSGRCTILSLILAKIQSLASFDDRSPSQSYLRTGSLERSMQFLNLLTIPPHGLSTSVIGFHCAALGTLLEFQPKDPNQCMEGIGREMRLLEALLSI